MQRPFDVNQTLKDWLDAERGRSTALAQHLEVSVSRVSQMADTGVPQKFMCAACSFVSLLNSI